MPFVRFFMAETDNQKVSPSMTMDCVDDADAMAKADAMLQGKTAGSTVDVWDRTRFIGRALARRESDPGSIPQGHANDSSVLQEM